MKKLLLGIGAIGAAYLFFNRREGAADEGAPPQPKVIPPTEKTPQQTVLQEGAVSFYGPGFDGKLTASGEVFNQNALTAAHKTLPFGTLVDVVDLDTGKSVRVRINDRGPFVAGRILDLSVGAATKLGTLQKGVAKNARLLRVV